MKPRAVLAAFGLFALAGSISGVSAAEGNGPRIIEAAEAGDDPVRFEPSPAALEPFGDSVAVSVPEDAVDLTLLEPLAEVAEQDLGTGIASWYGREFAGRRTANGERFDPSHLTAAHRTLPFGSKVRVTHGGKSVVVRINDRGPFHGNRVIDLSHAAATELGLVSAGKGHVELVLLER